MNTNFKQLPVRINKQASEWFTLLQSEQATDNQLQAFNRWLSESDDHSEAYRQIADVWEGLETMRDTDMARKLKLSVDHSGSPSNSFSSFLESMFTWISGHRIAATSFATIGFIAIFLVAFVPSFAPEPSPVVRYLSTVGEIRSITLEDQSVVDLGASSEIKVQFSDSLRQIELVRGEAFFDVSSDPLRPFVVNADLLSVQVVGTQFDVRKRFKGVSVSVVEGQVKVIDGEDSAPADMHSVQLTAGQRVAKNADAAISPIESVADAELGAWRTGRLIYRNANLIDVVSDAGRYYQGSFELNDENLFQEKVTLTLRSDQVALLPVMLSETLPVQSKVRPGNRIIISRDITKE